MKCTNILRFKIIKNYNVAIRGFKLVKIIIKIIHNVLNYYKLWEKRIPNFGKFSITFLKN